MEIMSSTVLSPEVIQLFSEHDDFIIDFLGSDSVYYTRYNENENIRDVWVAYCDGVPVGCFGYRIKSQGIGEVKRMFIKNEHRGKGVSKSLLSVVEEHAKKRGDHTLYLDTRVTLEPAITLYRRSGFVEISHNGLYVELEKKLL
jgi:GNAT superfamily N-acetyltransferase